MGEPRGDNRVEKAAALSEGYERAVEVGATDVDGGLVSLEDGGKVGDEAVVMPSTQREKVSWTRSSRRE
jgi:hypothetical protein